MKYFVNIVKGSQPLIFFVKSFILGVYLGSECAAKYHLRWYVANQIHHEHFSQKAFSFFFVVTPSYKFTTEVQQGSVCSKWYKVKFVEDSL